MGCRRTRSRSSLRVLGQRSDVPTQILRELCSIHWELTGFKHCEQVILGRNQVKAVEPIELVQREHRRGSIALLEWRVFHHGLHQRRDVRMRLSSKIVVMAFDYLDQPLPVDPAYLGIVGPVGQPSVYLDEVSGLETNDCQGMGFLPLRPARVQCDPRC